MIAKITIIDEKKEIFEVYLNENAQFENQLLIPDKDEKVSFNTILLSFVVKRLNPLNRKI